MLALSIRQPYAELILRGIKRIEYRSRATKIIGERFWIYASKGQVFRGKGQAETLTLPSRNEALTPASPGKTLTLTSPEGRGVQADNLAVEAPPPWMVELANALRLFPGELPRGVIVGSAVIEKCVAAPHPNPLPGGEGIIYHWHLTGVERAKRLRKPKGHPQPVWWRPG